MIYLNIAAIAVAAYFVYENDPSTTRMGWGIACFGVVADLVTNIIK